MNEPSRRSLLKGVGLGALAAVTPGMAAVGQSEEAAEVAREALRPRAISLSGIHAYASAHSVAAGEKLEVFVSASMPYKLSIVRLGQAIDDPSKDELVHAFESVPPRIQPIRPGSCVIVEKGLPPEFLKSDFAIQFWLRPFLTQERQAIITQATKDGEFGLCISDKKEVQVTLGSNFQLTFPALPTIAWTHVVLNCLGGKVALWLDGKKFGSAALGEVPELEDKPLILGGRQMNGEIDLLLDADLAQPAIYARGLTEVEVEALYQARALKSPPAEGLLGCWMLEEEQGAVLADSSPHSRQGKILNNAMWMIGGPSFDGRNVARFGNQYDPAKDSLRGHSLRLASDALYDAGWEVTHEFSIPAAARPGLYCVRADFESDGKPRVHYTTFLVRKGAGAERAPLLVLCSSNTWLAYNSTPFAKNLEAGQPWFSSTAGGVNVDPRAPAYSCYLNHRGGQPAYQFGTRMPWPVAGPNVWYSGPEMGYSHLMRGERFTHVWLEQNGYDFDLVLDIDLHRDPALLRDRKAILINGHSEYWSKECYQAVDQYLCAGGAAIVFSGNTMFWRVSFNPEGTMMECRKFDNRIGGMTHATIGELYHAQDGKRGSLMRECGMPAWEAVGLECDGWGGITPPEFGVYHAELTEHFLFKQPNEVGLKSGETFGHAPGGGVPKAIGHEWDVRLSRLKSYTAKIPAGVTLPDEPQGIVTLARGVRTQTHALDFFTEPTTAPDGTVAEMIYWERPRGGRVFHGGAIAVGWALSADPKLQALVKNVLECFGVKARG